MVINIDGVKVNYIKEGKGDYIFILHGWGCDLTVYKMMVDILKESYTVVAFDFPGFGNSDEPTFGWTMSDYTDFTIKFIEHFGCKKASFIGHSFGTRILIIMANRVELSFDIDKFVFIAGAGILDANADFYLKEVRKFQQKKFELIEANKFLELEKLRANSDSEYAFKSNEMCKVYENAVAEDLEPLLTGINVSTLLIWGDKDVITPVSDAKKMEELIPDAGLVLLENADHYPFFDQPYIFKRVLESFFEIDTVNKRIVKRKSKFS